MNGDHYIHSRKLPKTQKKENYLKELGGTVLRSHRGMGMVPVCTSQVENLIIQGTMGSVKKGLTSAVRKS